MSTVSGAAYRAAMAASRSRAARASRRRQRRLARQDHDLTPDDWAELQALWGGCAYCGASGPMQRDCVLPISRGGRYTITNVVPACRRCNTSKCNDEVTTWMRRKRLDERGFLIRHTEILARLALP
jgi:5-methylcytosine-specific restriction endonuclease McrA